MDRLLDYEKLCLKVDSLHESYWTGTLPMRWDYMKKVIDELSLIAPQTALELGTNKISLMSFSDSMDMDVNLIDPDNTCNKMYIRDATQTPWPIADKQYDVFVALQVMEHLSPAQSLVFSEIQRIARYAILSFPYRWNAPNNPSHHNIGDELIRKWNNHYPPYKILRSGEGNKCRVIYCFHFESEVKTHKISFPATVEYPRELKSRRFVPSDKKELINTYFDNIYQINRVQRQDQLNRMLQILGDLNISVEICDAVDGRSQPHYSEFLDYNKLPPGADRDTERELKRGRKDMDNPESWGQLKTFRLILQDMIKMGYNRVLFLEDDIRFISGFHGKFQEFTEKLAGFPWKILMLGADQQGWNMPEDLRYEDPGITQLDPSRPHYYPVNTLGTFALGLDKSVASEYLQSLERMQCPCDRALHPLFRRWFLHCFVAVPNLVIKDRSGYDITDTCHPVC